MRTLLSVWVQGAVPTVRTRADGPPAAFAKRLFEDVRRHGPRFCGLTVPWVEHSAWRKQCATAPRPLGWAGERPARLGGRDRTLRVVHLVEPAHEIGPHLYCKCRMQGGAPSKARGIPVLASPPASLCTRILPRTSARQHRIIRAAPNGTARQTAAQTARARLPRSFQADSTLKLPKIVFIFKQAFSGGAETQ